MAEEEEKYKKPGSIRRPDGSAASVGFWSRGVQPTSADAADGYTPPDPINTDVSYGGGGDGNEGGSAPGVGSYSDNAQFIDIDPNVRTLSRLGSLALPGLAGLGIGAINTGINLNNLSWVNNQRRALGLDELSGWETLKSAAGFGDYANGKVGSIDINGKQREVTYGGGLVGKGPDVEKRTSLTTEEAARRLASAAAYPGSKVQTNSPNVQRDSGGNEGRGNIGGGSEDDSGFGANAGSRDPSDDNLGGGGWGGNSGGSSGGGSGGQLSGGSGDDSAAGGSGNDTGGGGSERVICTELYRQGKISRADWLRDLRYTSLALSPRHVRGYHAWAIPTVRLMRKSSLWTEVWRVLGQARANQIAYIMGDRDRPDLFGIGAKIVLESFCWVLGGFVRTRDVKAALYNGKEPV